MARPRADLMEIFWADTVIDAGSGRLLGVRTLLCGSPGLHKGMCDGNNPDGELWVGWRTTH